MPAICANACGVLPTAFGLGSPCALCKILPIAAACASSIKYAPHFSISLCSCAAIGASATIACSLAQIVEQSNDFDFTINAAACAISALRSTYTGTLPGPTPIAGLPELCAARTTASPPVAINMLTAQCFINSFSAGIVTVVKHAIRPLGIPARSPASDMMRTVSLVHLIALGCGEIIMALRALTAINTLNIAVEVGFVEGVKPASTPTGQPISTIFFASSREITPTVFTSLSESHKNLLAN